MILKTENGQLETLKNAHNNFNHLYHDQDSNFELLHEINSKIKKNIITTGNDNFKGLWLDLSLNFNEIYNKTADYKITLTDKILQNYPSKMKYNSIIEESLLFTPFSILNYDIALQKNADNIIYQLKDFITASKIWKNIFSLIQGIPSELFLYDENEFAFIQVDKEIRLVGCLPKITENFFKFFIEFGSKLT